MTARAAIIGLGMSGPTRSEARPAYAFAKEAIDRALTDAGVPRTDVDGLLICRSGAASDADLDLSIRDDAGLAHLKLLNLLYGEGTSAAQTVQAAALAIAAGLVRFVVCVFADAPVVPNRPSGRSFGRIKTVKGVAGLRYCAGLFGGGALYALAARRHMHDYGTAPEHLGAVAVAARQWAAMNPQAMLRNPLTLQDYLAARWVVEPLRLFDFAIPVNGAIALVLTAADRACDHPRPPVYVRGMSQGHVAGVDRLRFDDASLDGIVRARDALLHDSGLSLDHINVCQIYDAFSFATIAVLEAYGFCARGEGGPFAASGAIAPGGALPTNTGGGHLSAHYLQGMTPIAEGVIQARGEAGERQCENWDFVLVTNEGGRFDHHAALILSPHKDAT